jgi:hypothetical protein
MACTDCGAHGRCSMHVRGGMSLALAKDVSAPAISVGHVIAAEWSILDVRDTRMMKLRNI